MEIVIKRTQDLTSEEMTRIYLERVKVFIVEQNCPYQEVDEDDFYAKHVLMKDNGRLVGYARILDHEDYVAIGRVLVIEDCRGKGLSKYLMSEILKSLDTDKPVRLSAQTYISELYASLGFEEISDEYLEDDIPHIDMQLKE